MGLLSQIQRLITPGHREAIKKVFETLKAKSPFSSDREAQFEAKRLVNRVVDAQEERVFFPGLAESGVKISSDSHNQNMEGAFIDLNALYKETSNIGAIQTQQTESLLDDFAKARAAILKLINDARVFAIRSKFPEFDDIKLVNFNISRNTSKDSPTALVDPDTRTLKLPQLLKRRNHLERRGLRKTVASVEVLGQGQVGQLSRQFTPNRAIDSKRESFWAEVIYSDVVFQTVYNRYGPDATGSMVDIINGPVIRYKLSFTNIEAVNQIKILPFGDFPIKVLEITYRTTNSSLIRVPVPDFVQEESLDWMEFNFDTVFAADVEIVLAQETYRNLAIRVPKNVLFSTDFFLRLIESRTSDLNNQIPQLADVNVGGVSAIYDEAVSDLASLIDTRILEKTPTTEIDLAGKTILSIGEALVNFDPSLADLLEEATVYTDSLPKQFQNEIETLNKVEYIVGAREIEASYVIYSPIGNYSSEKFEPAATVTNVELEVDERHPVFRGPFGEFRRTSTEWSIEFSPERVVPIFPVNQVEEGFVKVRGEFLDVSTNTFTGLSRFRSQFAFANVRENDELLTPDVDYDMVWNDQFEGRLQIGIKEERFDRGKLYTIDYIGHPQSTAIDVLEKFNDKRLATPDIFENTGPDNDLDLSYFPYVNYGIINSDDFTYDSNADAWEYEAPTGAHTSGRAQITPTWLRNDGSIIQTQTGSVLVSGISGLVDGPTVWNQLDQDFFIEPYDYFLKITDVPGAIFNVKEILNDDSLELEDIPVLATGFIGDEIPFSSFIGDITTGGYINVPYSLEVVYRNAEQIFGFDNVLYQPVTVLVGGTPAKNITDYQNLEQPAFTIGTAEDGEFEFIHDGKKIFLNQPVVNTEVLVDYRWLTQYARVNCRLRANKAITPSITPQINELRMLMNTTIL